MSRRLVVALGLTAALLAGCSGADSSSSTAAADPNATFHYATVFGASSFDPHKTKITTHPPQLKPVYLPPVHPGK
ncbi:ABC transporter substrate-binding protein, partial [Rhodococcus sp. NPDC058514]